MGDEVFHVFERATRAGEELVARGTRAVAASYDPSRQSLDLTLANGAKVAIPVGLVEGLAKASESDRAGVEVTGIGHGLHWPALDLDLTVPGLLAGVFGTERWMNARRAARAGAASSAAKATAARRNGAKGGRPRKASS